MWINALKITEFPHRVTRTVSPLAPVQHDSSSLPDGPYDAVLVGAGIMSATLAALAWLDPSMRLLLVERLEAPAQEVQRP